MILAEPAHKIGFRFLDIVCKCGAEFGSAQFEAVQHVKLSNAADLAASKLRWRKWQAEVKAARRREFLEHWQTVRDLAPAFQLSKRHTLRLLRAMVKAGTAEVRQPTARYRLEWRAVVR